MSIDSISTLKRFLSQISGVTPKSSYYGNLFNYIDSLHIGLYCPHM